MDAKEITEIFGRYRRAIISAYENEGGFPIAKFYVDEIIAKSKEEAGERLVEAWKLIPKDLNAYIVAQIDKALTLAAFGKEET